MSGITEYSHLTTRLIIMSQPLRKRPRIHISDPESVDAVEGNALDDDGDTSMTISSTTAMSALDGQSQQMKQIKDVMIKLNDSLDALESCSDRTVLPTLLGDSSIEILRLKAIQQRVLQQTRITQSVLSQLTATRDEQELQLQNLRYQQSLNETFIANSKDLDSTQLLQLAQSVKGARKDIAANLSGDETTMDDDDEGDTTISQELIKDFLGGDPRNPDQRTSIVVRLNQEVADRQKLSEEVGRWRQALMQAKKIKTAKSKLLGDLPHRLAEMEKASLPLQKFCQKSLDVTQKLGTQRRQRLNLAATLPKALYTLFYQLQACLDIMITAASVSDPGKAGLGRESLPVVNVPAQEVPSTSQSSSAVVLEVPIPTIWDSGTVVFSVRNTATITFEYSDEADMVFASCVTDNGIGSLISELFPGDKGEWTPFESDRQDAATLTGTKININARPYHWCNYLAGLHIAPGEQSASKMYLSAKVVIDALIRKSRAMATLQLILECLSVKSHPIPVHMTMKTRFEPGGSNTVRLVKWTAVVPAKDADSSNIRIFDAMFKDTGSSTTDKDLTVRICIDVARYPSVPPQFKIVSKQSQSSLDQPEGPLGSLQSGQTPLYNESLARLQKHVNRDVNQLVTSSDETSYDWILAHQMAEMAKTWKEFLEGTAGD